LGQAFDDGGFPHAGFADEDRVVLRPSAENLQDTLDFVCTTDDGIQLPFLGQLSQVTSEFVECRCVALAIPLARRRFTQEGHRELSGGQEVGAKTPENLSADPFFFPQQTQQQMFAADVVMPEQSGFFNPVLDNFLDPRAEWNFPEGHRRAPARKIALDLETNLLGGEAHFFEDHQRNPIRLAKDGQHQVLGAQVIVLMALGFFTCQDDDLATLVREPFEHPASLW